MKNNKIFILLPDGIGLRNFAYTDFYQIGIQQGFEIIFWNNTPFSLNDLGYNEIKIQNSKTHFLTDVYKNARKHIELNLNIKKHKDSVYNSYRFPFVYSSFKNVIKNLLTKGLILLYTSDSGLQYIRKKIKNLERTTISYKNSIKTLQKEQPALVFCTNQRPVTGIATMLAAQDLGIPTATFIFSWDNLPKATMVLETDYYFVWSEYMKKELLFYYQYIKPNQIIVTGTPQFEPYYDKNKLLTKDEFFKKNGLDFNKKYICYSGDDVTTCPDDQQYLEDLAIAVLKLNKSGHNLGIIFRRCPVDFSPRFDNVLANYQEVIVPIAPQWERKGEMWNTILPTPDDIVLQVNTIAYTEMVVNLGSSMVFDFVVNNKPCAYINYNVNNKVLINWSVEKIYNYVHFRSMPEDKAVIWLNNSEEIASKIENALQDATETIEYAKKWFEIINQHSPQNASKRIWDAIKIITKCT